jgi:probable rRNA maturation factor
MMRIRPNKNGGINLPEKHNLLEIEVVITDPAWPRSFATESVNDVVCRAMHQVLEVCKIDIVAPAEICVVLGNDAEQQCLNKKWRGQDKTTNVLSFPQITPFARPEGMLGDVVFARETVAREALEQQKSLADHFTHLVVHGFMHILGYDHETDKEAVQMEGLEIRILARLGIANPYAD